MEQKQKRNKIIFIPGWMHLLETYKVYDGIEIWDKRVDYKKKIDADYLVAFSLGNCFALANWKENKNLKLILVNPLVLRGNSVKWLWRYLRYKISEGKMKDRKVASGFWKYIKNLFYTRHLIRFNIEEQMEEEMKGMVTVIRGKQDDFFCDEKSARFLRENNISLVEIDGVGHNWDGKIDEEIRKIIGE